MTEDKLKKVCRKFRMMKTWLGCMHWSLVKFTNTKLTFFSFPS